jgi:hypothetical protein
MSGTPLAQERNGHKRHAALHTGFSGAQKQENSLIWLKHSPFGKFFTNAERFCGYDVD